jgi:hypothetical protein
MHADGSHALKQRGCVAVGYKLDSAEEEQRVDSERAVKEGSWGRREGGRWCGGALRGRAGYPELGRVRAKIG